MQDPQLSLIPNLPTDTTPTHSLDERFEAFHQANPHVAKNLISLALYARERGAKRVGVKALVERLRWEYNLKTEHPDYKINNSYTSRYARMLNQIPRLAGMIETRKLKTRTKGNGNVKD